MNARRAAARAILAIGFVVAVPLFVSNVVLTCRGVARLPVTASTRDANVFLEGESHKAEMDRVRAAVPRGGAYVLVGSSDEDRVKWLRYELAPRLAWLAGYRKGIRWEFTHRDPPPQLPRWTVLAGAEGEPPRLVPTSELLAHGLPPNARDEDPDLPGWLDEPSRDGSVKGAFVVRGWCQEKGSRPCASIRAFVDGNEVEAPVVRAPRPDVAAAFPAIGECSRAGYELRPAPPSPGIHEVSALFIGESGHWRRIGPWRFRWAP